MKHFILASWAFLLGCSGVAYAQVSTNDKYLLNERFGSIPKKVQLGTLIENAEDLPPADGTITAAKLASDAVTTAKITDANVTLAKLATPVMVEATGTLTQANIVAMNGTPVTLIAAQGSGTVIVIDEMEFFHDYATAVYSGGGDVAVEYATSGSDIIVFDVALVTASADDNWIVKPSTYTSSASSSSHLSLTSSQNKAVQITNATAVFADGDAANVIKWRIRYHVVTLRT